MALKKLKGFNNLNSLNTLGGSSSGDLTTDELFRIAQAQGGSVAQRAMELIHPERSILSTAGNGFKNLFKGFINTIAIPSEIVAGVLSPDLTIGEAIDQHKRVSDVIFGDTNIFSKDGTPTTMQKIGNFVVRLPVDILSDPLTYFGKLPFAQFLPKIDVLENAAKEIGLGQKLIKEGGVISREVTPTGNKVLSYLTNLQRQMRGETGFLKLEENTSLAAQRSKLLESGLKEADVQFAEKTLTGKLKEDVSVYLSKEKLPIDFTEAEFKDLLKKTTESSLNTNWAKHSLSQLLEHNPALAQTVIDKGGIKYFGKTLLSAQRIQAVKQLIPGMTKLDEFTLPLRMSIAARFNPAVQYSEKVGKYVRVPEEYMQQVIRGKNLTSKFTNEAIVNLQNMENNLKFNNSEIDKIYDAAVTSIVPDDARLYQGYSIAKGFSESEAKLADKILGTRGRLENYVGNVFVPEDTRGFSSKFATEVGTQKKATFAKYVMQDSEVFRKQLPEIKKIVGDTPDITIGKTAEEIANISKEGVSQETSKFSQKFVKEINGAKSTQEINTAIANEIKSTVDRLVAGVPGVAEGMTTEAALATDQVKELFQMQSKIGKLIQSPERTGTLEDAFLQPRKEGDAWIIEDAKGNTYKRMQAHAKELKRNYGFENIDTNILTIMTNQAIKNSKQLVGQHLMEGMIRQFARIEGSAGTENWVQIDSDALSNVAERIGMPLITKDGQAYLFHPAVAKDFEGMLKGLTDEGADPKFWQNFDKIQRYWKASVTSIFPMFHGRNAISNVLQNFLDLGYNVFNPYTNIMSANIVYNDRIANGLARKMAGTGEEALQATKDYNTLMAKIMFTDKTEYSWTYGELRRVMKENDIAFTPNITGMMDVRTDPDKMLTSVFNRKSTGKKIAAAVNPLNVDTFKPTVWGRELGTSIEEYSRTLNFITNLNNTGDVLHAAARTKLFLFDYQHLTKFEKNTMRRLIPFYTWTRKNLELQVNALLTTPGRIANELTMVNSIGDIFGGSKLTDKERALLPSWMANTIALKREGKNGNEEILSGFGTPIEQPFQALQPNSLLGSISPLFRYPVEAMTGYQFFQGKLTSQVIDAQNFDNAPDVIKEFIGYGKYEGITKDGKKYSKSYSLRPANMHLINNLPFIGRIGNVLGQMTNANTTADSKLLQSITGINFRSYNFDSLEQQQEYKLQQDIEDMMTKAGIGGKFNRFYLKKNTKQMGD